MTILPHIIRKTSDQYISRYQVPGAYKKVGTVPQTAGCHRIQIWKAAEGKKGRPEKEDVV
jgi:hypothetical protein